MGFHFVMFLVVVVVAFSMHAMASAAPLGRPAVAGAASVDFAAADVGTRPSRARTGLPPDSRVA